MNASGRTYLTQTLDPTAVDHDSSHLPRNAGGVMTSFIGEGSRSQARFEREGGWRTVQSVGIATLLLPVTRS